MARLLRLIKQRGSAHGTNMYHLPITKDGISIIPVTNTKLKTLLKKQYFSTGVNDLDRMLGGKGYQIGSMMMFTSRSGTGKTIFVSSLAKAAQLKRKKICLCHLKSRLMISDGEMRHGQKSSFCTINGFKQHIAIALDHKLLLATLVRPPNESEHKSDEWLKPKVENYGEVISKHIDQGYHASSWAAE